MFDLFFQGYATEESPTKDDLTKWPLPKKPPDQVSFDEKDEPSITGLIARVVAWERVHQHPIILVGQALGQSTIHRNSGCKVLSSIKHKRRVISFQTPCKTPILAINLQTCRAFSYPRSENRQPRWRSNKRLKWWQKQAKPLSEAPPKFFYTVFVCSSHSFNELAIRKMQ